MDGKLAGLEEKFRILNNDELADALQVRLEELSHRSEKWRPEVLSLLLQLSDQPAQRSKIEDLDLLKSDPLPPPLTWADIIADDPFDNQDGVWDTVDFAADGSDEDGDIVSDESSPVGPAADSNSGIDGAEYAADVLVLPIDDAALHDILNGQFWRTSEDLHNSKDVGDLHSVTYPTIQVTETQAIREVVFMLLGLPTSIYIPSRGGTLTVSPCYQIRHLSQDSARQLFHKFNSLGNELFVIRDWLNRQERVPLLQTLQAALELRMRLVEKALSAIQARIIIDTARSFTSSLLELWDETNHITKSVQQVSKLLAQAASSSEDHMPFRILELLYNASCVSNSIGDFESYKFMATLFFDCFHTYLKPVRHWMKFGGLSKEDQGFFVTVNEEQVAPSFVWQKQHQLIHDGNGHLHAPQFLHLAAKKIFTTGKSVNLLGMLGQGIGDVSAETTDEVALDYKNVCCQEEPIGLSPFSELFDLALEKWIGNQHSSSSQTLRRRLELQCGLAKSLDALEIVYFSRNGVLTSQITTTIFDRMDRGIEAWHDGFLLTELFQSVFGALPCIETERLSVRPSAGSHQNIQSSRRSMKVLGTVRVRYTLPWPIANIIKQEFTAVYQRIFIFLLQTQRAKHMLERQRLIKSALPALESEEEDNHLVFTLRHRLLWFSNTLLTYLTDMVISASTAEMRLNMAAAEDVDGMIAVHEAYMSKLEEQCLIDKRLDKIHQAIISLLDLVILFSDAHASYRGRSYFDPTNRSLIARGSRRRVTSKQGERFDAAFDSSDDEAEANDDVADLSYISSAKTPYVDTLRNVHAKFTELLNFVIAGLHGVHRTGGEPWWEALADSFAAGIKMREHYRIRG